jgi:hypothetical protein
MPASPRASLPTDRVPPETCGISEPPETCGIFEPTEAFGVFEDAVGEQNENLPQK